MSHRKRSLGSAARVAVSLLGGFFLSALSLALQGGELVLAHFVATNHPIHVSVLVPLAERLAADSGGGLTLRIIPGLSDPARQYQRVTNREADLVFGLPDYTPEVFPRTRLSELPELAATPSAATRMLANALPRTLAPEFGRVVPLGVWVGEAAALVSRGRPIRGLGDMAGLRIRAADPGAARLLEIWGATPVILTANQILPALQNSQIDAAFIGSSGIAPFQLDTVATSCTINLPVVLTSFFLLMNQQSWEGLSPAHQLILRNATGLPLSLTATAANEKAGQLGLDKLRQKNIEIIELSSEQSASFRAATPLVTAEALAALATQQIDGQKVLDSFRPRLSIARGVAGVDIRLFGGEGLAYGLRGSVDFESYTSLGDRTGDAAGQAVWNVPALEPGAQFLRVVVY